MLEDVTPSSLRRLRRSAPWIVIFGLAAGPAAGMWALAWRIDDIPPELRVTPVPVFTGPTLRIRDGRTNAVAKLEIGDGPALIAPEWSGRSEEHTSELQSRENLVCRLLLEKKQDYPAQHL